MAVAAKTNYIPFVMTGDSLSVYTDECHIIPRSHPLFTDILEAVRTGNEVKLRKLISQDDVDGLKLKDDGVYYNGKKLNNDATAKLFELKAAGFNAEPLFKFIENCYKNPFPKVVESLWDFISTRGMPLTEDGCFLGYKYCNADYWDSHTGRTVQYIPGTTVSVPRDDTADYSGEECSGKGLHVGNVEYSAPRDGRRSGQRYLIVKVNPKDVVSVPMGAHRVGAQKIRTWEMFVVKEITQPTEVVEAPVVNDKAEGKVMGTYQKGQRLCCIYKDGDGKEATYTGFIKNVGNMYLELSEGWTSSDNTKIQNYRFFENGRWYTTKLRLKTANIQEVL